MRLSDYAHTPPVSAVMTPFPYFARPEDPVSRVVELMRDHDIRHIPVKDHDEVVGIVSDRDIRWIDLPGSTPGGPEEVTVRDVQIPDPYTAELATPLDTVLREMSARRIGTAVVVRAGKLAGIVTVTDVCEALADLLEQRFGPSNGDDAA